MKPAVQGSGDDQQNSGLIAGQHSLSTTATHGHKYIALNTPPLSHHMASESRYYFDQARWIIPDVIIKIATHADIRSTSQERPRYEEISGHGRHWKIPSMLAIVGKNQDSEAESYCCYDMN
jgi:hypothetical protein